MPCSAGLSNWLMQSTRNVARGMSRPRFAAAALVAAHPGKVVVAVSHADPIKAYVAQTMGCHLDLFQRIVVSPCSVTAVAHGPDGTGAIVLCVNSTGRDLTALAPS